MITYLYTVCDENERFIEAYNQISASLSEGDDIIVQYDTLNGDPHLLNLLNENNIQYIEYEFNGNFSDMKNNAIKYVTNEWIFSLDGDEVPSTELLENIHSVIQMNNVKDGMSILRIDFNIETTESNGKGRHLRIWKNRPWVKWIGKVHEELIGVSMVEWLNYTIIHNRTTEESEKIYYLD
jgi:hypothetical protein